MEDTGAAACVLDATYDGIARLDVLVETFTVAQRPLMIVLSDHAPPPVWRALEDGLVQALVAKTASDDDLHRAICLAAVGSVLVVGHTRTRGPSAELHPHLSALTGQEHQLLDMVADGQQTRVIATTLGVTRGTARALVAALLQQMLADEPPTVPPDPSS
jgi:DNA-binding NarL/FixJ family response regulator